MTHLLSAGDLTTFLSIAMNDHLRKGVTVRQLRSMSSVKMQAKPGVWHRFMSADEAGAGSPELQATLVSGEESQWRLRDWRVR
jgi:hypothetical protein